MDAVGKELRDDWVPRTHRDRYRKLGELSDWVEGWAKYDKDFGRQWENFYSLYAPERNDRRDPKEVKKFWVDITYAPPE